MYSPFGKELRKIRIERDMSLKEMADGIDVSSAFLSAVEHGKKSIPGDLVDRIVKAFKLALETKVVLEKAAEVSRNEIKVYVDQEIDGARSLVAAFARKFPGMTDEQKQRIQDVLDEVNG